MLSTDSVRQIVVFPTFRIHVGDFVLTLIGLMYGRELSRVSADQNCDPHECDSSGAWRPPSCIISNTGRHYATHADNQKPESPNHQSKPQRAPSRQAYQPSLHLRVVC